MGEADMKPGLRNHRLNSCSAFGGHNSGGGDTRAVVVISVVYQDAVFDVPADDHIVVEVALKGLLAQFLNH